MDEERIRTQGRLTEAEQQAAALKIKLESGRDTIRARLDRWTPIEDIPAQEIPELAFEFAAKHLQYMQVKKQIAAMKKALGIRG